MKKIVIILAGMLFISVAYNIWWVGYERLGNEKTIEELNTLVKIDLEYINSLDKYYENFYAAHMLCNDTLSSELKGELSNEKLKEFMDEYASKAITSSLSLEEANKIKEKRLQFINNAKYTHKIEQLN